MRVLSIDFDYFQDVSKELVADYPDGIDVGSSVSLVIWGSKIATNPALEEVGILESEYVKMTHILYNQNKPECLISRTHKDIYDFIKSHNEPLTELVNVDMHHDLFNDNKASVDCGNWLGFIIKEYDGAKFSWIANPISREVYGLKDDRFQFIRNNLDCIMDKQFDLIFLCRSDTWLPPQLDKYFDMLKDDLIGISGKCMVSKEIQTERNYQPYVKQIKDALQIGRD